MKEFETSHGDLFKFASVEGWDGYCAAAVSEKVKTNALHVWSTYKLQGKPYDLMLNNNGTVTFEVKSVHGYLDIMVAEDRYVAGIVNKDHRVIMPDVTRMF